MEFVELLEKIAQYVPSQYTGVANFLEIALPVLFISAAAATCFFGHKLHKIWTGFLFFCISVFVFFVIGALIPKAPAWPFLTIGIIAGIAAAIYSHRLFKVQLFIVNMIMSYIFVSDFLVLFLPKDFALLISFICGIAVGILATRYKYIFLLITTSVTGASMTISTLFQVISYSNNVLKIVLIILLSAAGLLVQFYFERKELKETGHKLLERVDKVHKTAKKAQLKIQSKKQELKIKKDSDRLTNETPEDIKKSDGQ